MHFDSNLDRQTMKDIKLQDISWFIDISKYLLFFAVEIFREKYSSNTVSFRSDAEVAVDVSDTEAAVDV